MTDPLSPQSNGRRAMALAVAMIIAADGEYSARESEHVYGRAIGSINTWGALSEKNNSLIIEPALSISEFRTILSACRGHIEKTAGPNEQFVDAVLSLLTEKNARVAALQLMQEAAISDGLDERNEKGILVHAMRTWEVSSTDLGDFQQDPLAFLGGLAV